MDPLAEKFEQLKNALKTIRHPLLIIHPNPDADALGSAFALSLFLEKLFSSRSDIFCIYRPGNIFQNLFPIHCIKNKVDLTYYDALFFLDRGDVYFKLKFNEKISRLKQRPPQIVNLDHHPHTFIPGALNILDSTAAATCEIIFRFFEYHEVSIEPKMAQYLLNGIYTDTGGFRHENTTSHTLEIAAKLLKKGASISKINRVLFASKPLSTLKLWAIALERAQVDPKTGMAVSFITKQDLKRCNASAEDISGISEILNTISESKFSLVLSEREQNKIKASLRSENYKGVDVSRIARKFRGGGHKLASGFEIKGKLRQIGNNWIIE
jgi:phosphoesterase RecJ-like protein